MSKKIPKENKTPDRKKILNGFERTKWYIDENGNYGMRIYDEYGALLLDTATWPEPKPYNHGWISVEDRLPEPNTWVIVHTRGFPIADMARWTGEDWDSGIEARIIDGSLYSKHGLHVTHWQPQPEPPEGSEDEKI